MRILPGIGHGVPPGALFAWCVCGKIGSGRFLGLPALAPWESPGSKDVTDPGHDAEDAVQPGPASATSESLLERLKRGDADGWRRLLTLYSPLVLWWCHGAGLRPHDAEEVAQEVFLTVSTKVADFTRRWQRGGFRAWLRSITRHKLYAHYRRRGRQPQALGGSAGQELLADVRVDAAEAAGDADEATERSIVRRQALDLIRAEFDPRTWDAAWQTIVEGRRAADVAANLGMTTNAVYIAKSRVLSRGRELLRDLV